MRVASRNITATFLLGALLAVPFPSAAEDGPAAGYHDYAALSKAVQQLARQHPKLARLVSIGKTHQERDLWLLKITSSKGPAPQDKQALLIVGNAEGDHVIGSEVALGIAEYLVKSYLTDEKVTEALDSRTFYIIPRLNPDGAELFFDTTLREHSGNLNPRDDDYDWQEDEDGPEDLNRDGYITLMRVKDQAGEWSIDDEDPRRMQKKEADTPLDKLYRLYPEGLDDDGDELYNEDGPGGFNINRNFPHNFGYKFRGVKVYPASESETRALIDFMTGYVPELKTQPHANICAALLFSRFDNLAAGSGIECGTPAFPEPPGGDRAAAPQIRMLFRMGRRGGQQEAPQAPPRDPQPKSTDRGDEPLFKAVSEKYQEITGIRSAHSEKPFGSLLEYAYFQYGVPAFSANLWSVREPDGGRPQTKAPAEKPGAKSQTKIQAAGRDRQAVIRQVMTRGGGGAGRPGHSGSQEVDEKWLAWIDKQNDGQGFIAWTKYQHPQLGEVEIGGFQPYLRINPPADQIPELVEKHAQFALYLASQFAEITMEEPQVKRLSSRLFELKIKLRNRGKFPYAAAMGQRSTNIPPIVLQMKLADTDVMKLFGGNTRVDLPSLAAGAEREFKWMIITPPGKAIDLTLWARNGGGRLKKRIVLE
jgi:hypothetical protein